MRKVKIGEKTFFLPFADRIPISDEDRNNLAESIEETGAISIPVLCWKEKRTADSETVVDGANRVLIAADKKYSKVPTMHRSFESEQEAAEECDRLNYDRRQSPEEVLRRHRAERITRVAQARVNGESIRTIAEKEEISKAQVERDLAEASSTVPGGGTVEPADGKVKGKDDKVRPAHKPPILCSKCQRLGAVEGCQQCKEAKEAAKAAKKKPEREPGDDTEQIKADKKAERDAGKNGRISFDAKCVETPLGQLVRAIEEVGKSKGKGEHYKKLDGLMNSVATAWKAWKKELVKA